MIRTGKKFSKPTLSKVINGDLVLNDEEEKADHLIRLDTLAAQTFPDYSRRTLQGFVGQGFLKVNNEIIKVAKTKVDKGAKLELNVPEKPEKPKLDIIYEDDNVLVLDKPAGMLTHPHGDFTIEPTLEDYGLICHRLDRATSGVIILAKNLEAKRKVMKQFQDRKAHKTYVAITDGCPKNPEALIDLPIARNLKKHNTFYVSKQGRPSQTHYRVIKHNQRYAMLELKPTTGRTHQLRVHLAYLGTPIAGDPIYNHDTAPRLFLHASELEITIPGGERKIFESPLPPIFDEFYAGGGTDVL